ncbi:MAG: hypothetical protein ACLFV7_02305 [Phycisphaerae bacterium]
MARAINFTQDELSTLTDILTREIDSTRSELHHTDDRDYRKLVQRHIDVTENILGEVRHAAGGEYKPTQESTDQPGNRAEA